jgi:predicted dehydrogenase
MTLNDQAATPGPRLGIGFVGAGPVTQAIHLPTIARLGAMYRVAHVMDVNEATARTVAGRVGAEHSTKLDALLADEAVDVVAINSPSPLHAEQAMAAIRAGKRAVFVEKPFATTREEAEAVARLASERGVPVMVGAMHTYDPGWIAARTAWPQAFANPRLIRSSIVLPMNARFEDWATEVAERGPPPPPRDLTKPDMRQAAIAGGTLGLAIHNLPLIRSMLPQWRDLTVMSATPLAPFGYMIHAIAGDVPVQLLATMHRHARPEWTLECFGASSVVRVEFTPSFVHAGSAVATLHGPDGVVALPGADHNGYEGEWRHMHAVLTAGAEPSQDLSSLTDDLVFAVGIAEAAGLKAREEHAA